MTHRLTASILQLLLPTRSLRFCSSARQPLLLQQVLVLRSCEQVLQAGVRHLQSHHCCSPQYL
jgi:hypothetical protein